MRLPQPRILALIQRTFLRAFVPAALIALTLLRTSAAEPEKGASQSLSARDAPHDPVEHWEFDYESALLWKVGGGATPLTYTLVPQILTLKTPAVSRRAFFGGELVLRSRFSLLLEPIITGPETHFIGATASGCLEWWDLAKTRVLFFSSGGGLGGMDSRGHEIAGAQGQDLNFTWFIYTGARIRFNNTMNVGVGAYFQHISNRDLDRVNPGLNALGPIVSVGWHY